MTTVSTARQDRLRFERFPFFIGVRDPDDGTDLPRMLPFELRVDPRAALPALVLTPGIEAALARAYAHGSMISTPLGHSTLSTERLGEARDRITGLLGGDVAGMRVLEVGCGTGMLLNEFKLRGAQVVGCEIGPQGREAAQRYGIEVIDTPLRAGLLERRFDCVYSVGLLEHIPDLEGIFAAFRDVLKGGGLLVHSVPNAGLGFDGGRVEELLHEHTNYFRPASARRLLAAQGFADARAEPTRAGNELHLWGRYDPAAPVGWPGVDDPDAVEREREWLAGCATRMHALLRAQVEAVDAMLAAGESVGFYAGGHVISSFLTRTGDVRFYDGDEYKHGKVWLQGLPPIRPPHTLRTDPVDHLVVCADHYFTPIHAALQKIGLPDTVRLHRLMQLSPPAAAPA